MLRELQQDKHMFFKYIIYKEDGRADLMLTNNFDILRSVED